MTRRLLLAAALGAGLYATGAPAQACDLQHCPGTSIVCGFVDCDPPPVVDCWQPLGIFEICV